MSDGLGCHGMPRLEIDKKDKSSLGFWFWVATVCAVLLLLLKFFI